MWKRLFMISAGLVIMLTLVMGATIFLRAHSVAGIVRDTAGNPIPTATVRVKAATRSVQSNDTGRFLLTDVGSSLRKRITAWKEGYYVTGSDAWPWSNDLVLTLTRLPSMDNLDYVWVQPSVQRTPLQSRLTESALDLAEAISFAQLFVPLTKQLLLGCRDCHAETVYRQWAGSAHALGASTPRFLSMYNGSDLNGNSGELTRYGYSRDYGSFPLRPDPGKPYYGPGYKLDFPKTQGNCATCHLPGAALDAPYSVDPNTVTGVNAQGVHCDFCHKIAAVLLEASTGRPKDEMPGVLSIKLTRPAHGQQVFYGPYDDVDVGPDTYLPLYEISEICAPCHQASFWGVPIYQSFAEWQQSTYPARGIACQDCHMRPEGGSTNFAPNRGGVERDPDNIPGHAFPGAADETMLKEAVDLDAAAGRGDGKLTVRVSITNSGAGHHVPTDSPMRQLILLVDARSSDGTPLQQLDGETVPDWGGVGDPEQGRYAGSPGKGIAKVLQELWTGYRPSAAYWSPTRIESDNRIPAGARDLTTFTFSDSGDDTLHVHVRLLYRRAFIELMDQKAWDMPDIPMAEQSLLVPVPGKEVSQ
jgi:hypothetical protein